MLRMSVCCGWYGVSDMWFPCEYASFGPITVDLAVSSGYSTADSSFQLNHISTEYHYTTQLAYIAALPSGTRTSPIYLLLSHPIRL